MRNEEFCNLCLFWLIPFRNIHAFVVASCAYAIFSYKDSAPLPSAPTTNA